MMNHKRIHPVSSFLVLLVVLVLGAGGAMAPALAAHEVSGAGSCPAGNHGCTGRHSYRLQSYKYQR